ncbi:hypothetical protein C3941_09380 [Kaistia algarum]|nr:hypothetical protein C3941_09380 [Kaistia algarum]
MTALTTVGGFLQSRYEIHAHCLACGHHAVLDLETIAATHGRDLGVIGEHSPLRRMLRCRCGTRNATIRIHPPTNSRRSA